MYGALLNFSEPVDPLVAVLELLEAHSKFLGTDTLGLGRGALAYSDLVTKNNLTIIQHDHIPDQYKCGMLLVDHGKEDLAKDGEKVLFIPANDTWHVVSEHENVAFINYTGGIELVIIHGCCALCPDLINDAIKDKSILGVMPLTWNLPTSALPKEVTDPVKEMLAKASPPPMASPGNVKGDGQEGEEKHYTWCRPVFNIWECGCTGVGKLAALHHKWVSRLLACLVRQGGQGHMKQWSAMRLSERGSAHMVYKQYKYIRDISPSTYEPLWWEMKLPPMAVLDGQLYKLLPRMSSTHSFSDNNLSDLDDCPMCHYPNDREANPIQLSFNEFCIKANDLYAALQENTITPRQEAFAMKEFYRFVLVGHTHMPDGDTAHITLNACNNLPDNVQYEVSWDYDSLIGVSNDLPYSTHLQLTPVPPFKLTLKTDNHMKSMAYLNCY
ncbi:hypothetical protein EDC04DRAFT_2600004 [Pisolithus marmoratus]|nr:hypothetical protein EDC04DRAFT_2600004 [Pisolithus marmoratus]